MRQAAKLTAIGNIGKYLDILNKKRIVNKLETLNK